MSNSFSPLVSVITPFLNGGDWLRQAVDSVIAQTYTNWQHILIDDGSGAEVTAIAKSYANQYPGKIIYTEHRGHVNRGVTASRNQGINQATGGLVAFLDSDDCWLPEKLEKQVEIYRRYPQAGMICEASKYWFRWEKENATDIVIPVGGEQDKLYEPPTLIYTLYPLGKGAAPCPSGMIMKKSLLEEIGGFEEGFKGANQVYEDQAFLCKIYLTSPVYISSNVNNLYRQRTGSLMESISQKKQYYKVRSYFLQWMENYLHEKRIYDPLINKLLKKAKFESNNPELTLILSKFRTRIQRLLNSQNP
jgi:glycosyltransferase involved in cell wall biosynthesis